MAASSDINWTCPPGLLELAPLQLVDLDPVITHSGEISAVVTLLWPFSISSKKLSVLVTEPNFRLRDKRGQLKATFLGEAAIKLKDLQIGNIVKISLEGAKWEPLQDALRAEVPWRLEWEQRLRIKVYDEEKLQVDIDEVFAPASTSHTLETIEAVESQPEVRLITPPPIQNLSITNEWPTPLLFGSSRSFWSSQNNTLVSDRDQLEDEGDDANDSSFFDGRSSFQYLTESREASPPNEVFESMLPEELIRSNEVVSDPLPSSSNSDLELKMFNERHGPTSVAAIPSGDIPTQQTHDDLDVRTDLKMEQYSHSTLAEESFTLPKETFPFDSSSQQNLDLDSRPPKSSPSETSMDNANLLSRENSAVLESTIENSTASQETTFVRHRLLEEPLNDVTILREASAALDKLIDTEEKISPMDDVVSNPDLLNQSTMTEDAVASDNFQQRRPSVANILREASDAMDKAINAELFNFAVNQSSDAMLSRASTARQSDGGTENSSSLLVEAVGDGSKGISMPTSTTFLTSAKQPNLMEAFKPTIPTAPHYTGSLNQSPNYQQMFQHRSVGFTFGPRTDIFEAIPKPPGPVTKLAVSKSRAVRMPNAEATQESQPALRHSSNASSPEESTPRTPITPMALFLPDRSYTADKKLAASPQSPEAKRLKSIRTMLDGSDKSSITGKTVRDMSKPDDEIKALKKSAVPPVLSSPSNRSKREKSVGAFPKPAPRSAFSVVHHGKTVDKIVDDKKRNREPSSDDDEDSGLQKRQQVDPKYTSLSGKLEEYSTRAGVIAGITTSLSDFPAISVLYWGVTTDILAVNIRLSKVERARKGPRDYFTLLRVIDPSRPLGITVTVLRPFKKALPDSKPGDVVLLRSFKIQSRNHQLVATSTNCSAWAIWRHKDDMSVDEIESNRDLRKRMLVEGAGPEVEFAEQEQEYVETLGSWWDKMDETLRQQLSKGPGEEDQEETREFANGKRRRSVDVEDSFKETVESSLIS